MVALYGGLSDDEEVAGGEESSNLASPSDGCSKP